MSFTDTDIKILMGYYQILVVKNDMTIILLEIQALQMLSLLVNCFCQQSDSSTQIKLNNSFFFFFKIMHLLFFRCWQLSNNLLR